MSQTGFEYVTTQEKHPAPAPFFLHVYRRLWQYKSKRNNIQSHAYNVIL
jgi:hypothetical protein